MAKKHVTKENIGKVADFAYQNSKALGAVALSAVKELQKPNQQPT